MPKNYFFIIVIISLFLVSVFFYGLKPDEFILTGDEYISLSKQVSKNAFYIQQPEDFGTAYSTIILVTFFDRLFYLIGYQIDLSIHQIQQLLYFIKIVIILSISYIGFQKLSIHINKKKDELILFLIAIWYCFNSFALVYWHGNAFSLTALISYALAPLSFTYFLKSISSKSSLTDKVSLTLTIFFMSFTVYFLAVYVLILSIFTTLYLYVNTNRLIQVFKNLFTVLLIYTPFCLLNFFFVFDMFFNPIHSVNMVGGETYGMLQGGFLYPLFMWFSWAIYTIWHPRNIYTFYKYFYTLPSIIAPFFLYGLIVYKIQENRHKYFYVITLITLLLLFFIVKAAQPPFGGIYLFLIDHAPLFRVFRSPDSKIGFGIVLLLAILLTYNQKNIQKKVFVCVISFVILVQSYLIYTGVAIKGQSTQYSTDLVMRVTNEYQSLKYEIDSSPTYGYILPNPSMEYTQYDLGDGEVHLGQDLLSKFIALPISYVSPSGGITQETYEKLTKILESNNVAALNAFPIHYYLVRNDITQKKPDNNFISIVKKNWNMKYQSLLFTLYKNPHPLPIIDSPNVSFTMINPVQYHIKIKKLSQTQTLAFYQSYNKYWALYPVSSQHSYKPFFIYTPIFSSTHTKLKGYANKWSISKKEIVDTVDPALYTKNPDGSINVELILFFKVQALFCSALIISFSYAAILLAGLYLYTYAPKRPL